MLVLNQHIQQDALLWTTEHGYVGWTGVDSHHHCLFYVCLNNTCITIH